MTDIGAQVAANAAEKSKPGPDNQSKKSCEPEEPHVWCYHIKGGTGLEIARCMLCGEFDWFGLNLMIQKRAYEAVAEQMKTQIAQWDQYQELLAMFRDLDRCEHGRHSIDTCFSCPDGISAGNPRLQPGDVLTRNYAGMRYVMPEGKDLGNLSAWKPTEEWGARKRG